MSKKVQAKWGKTLSPAFEERGWELQLLDKASDKRPIKLQDCVLVTSEDAVLEPLMKGVRIMIVSSMPEDQILKGWGYPFLVSKAAVATQKAAKQFVQQVESWSSQSDLLQSQSQEIEARVEEISSQLKGQRRKLQLLFRQTLRRSFPRHRHVDATVQYLESFETERVHFFDCFGDEDSEDLWIFGMQAKSYSISADVIDVLLDFDPRKHAEAGYPELYIKQWRQQLENLALKHKDDLGWVWLHVDTPHNQVSAFSDHANQGYLTLWNKDKMSLLPVSTDQVPKPQTLDPTSMLLFSTAMVLGDHRKNLEALEHVFQIEKLRPDTVLSHLHEQYVLFAKKHLGDGGASLMLRLRGHPLRKVGS